MLLNASLEVEWPKDAARMWRLHDEFRPSGTPAFKVMAGIDKPYDMHVLAKYVSHCEHRTIDSYMPSCAAHASGPAAAQMRLGATIEVGTNTQGWPRKHFFRTFRVPPASGPGPGFVSHWRFLGLAFHALFALSRAAP